MGDPQATIARPHTQAHSCAAPPDLRPHLRSFIYVVLREGMPELTQLIATVAFQYRGDGTNVYVFTAFERSYPRIGSG